MSVRALLLAILLPLTAQAQGFAGLGTSADDGFAVPERGRALAFPADHGPHPDYRIEWWYLTANLTGDDGRDYGIQWTLFRSALRPERSDGWQSPQIWMGHAGLTTPERHFVAEALARDGIGQAGVEAAPFRAWIDGWEMESVAEGAEDPLSRLRLSASGEDFAYALDLEAAGPLVAQGDRGFSVKSASGQASYYYSQPFYQVSGQLDLPEGPVEVTGQAWLDREWSSQPLDEDQSGWDWFSLHLGSGEKMMAFRLRSDGPAGDYLSGTWIASDGAATALKPDEIILDPLEVAQVDGREMPVGWRVRVPSRGIDVTTQAVNPQSWMATLFPYWEGPIRISRQPFRARVSGDDRL